MGNMNLERLTAISKLSKKDPQWKHRDIFRILNKDDLWIAAYESLKKSKGILKPESTSETMDGMSLKRLRNLREQVCAESYTFKTVNLAYIRRPDGRIRPLGLPTTNDKIVQEVMRMVLEAIYEPIFSKLSFGFRAGLGCHDALAHVEKRFRWVDHVIKSDIEQAYPTIDHHILVNILQKRIDDPRLIRLVWKLLGCGVLDEERVIWSKTGVPQGSIVSPLLANIYYHEFDEFIHELVEHLSTPEPNRKNLKSPAYKSLGYKIGKVSEQMRTHHTRSKERLQTPRLKELATRVEYVRHADDWMIGVSGDRKLALQIREKVGNFMKNALKQQLHPTETKVTDLRNGNVHFLGYEIFLPKTRPISRYKGKGVSTIRRGQPQLRFDIPVAKVIGSYVERGYFKQQNERVRPISRASYAVLEDHVIVNHYRSVWLGLLNYYSGCTNRGRLQYLHYLIHMSCAMTLGHRHRVSCSKIFKKYGKELKIQVPHIAKPVVFPYKTTWRLSERRWLRGSKVTISPLFKACLLDRHWDYHVPYVTQIRAFSYRNEIA
nr:hypothetical protein [Proteomonas sp. NEIS-1375]